jgi:hypothetical protein
MKICPISYGDCWDCKHFIGGECEYIENGKVEEI